MKTRILLADDHQVFRQGLRRLLVDEADMDVVAEAGDGRAAVDLAGQLAPHVAVMDLSMPRLNGIDATRAIRKLSPAPRVIILSMHLDRRFVADALHAGASGYVLKEAAFDELTHAIRVARDGGVYLAPRIAGLIAEDYRSGHLPRPGRASSEALSDREREVLQLLAEGQTTKQIGRLLRISPKTVEAHRRRIMGRLKTESLADLIKFALREGLTQIE